ncbi:siderophore-iron reductase FhuF [Roseibium algae]|uniref:Siderophore-iron reductase FhuF n=1 Tax=Roseibium algae TaxID=3123038 RepID=A0ABU8TFL7_9HYPH
MTGADLCLDEKIDLSDYLEDLFHGPAAHLADRFSIQPIQSTNESIPETPGVNTGNGNPIQCSELTDPTGLKRLLDAYAKMQFPGDDVRSVVSFWSQWYFGFLLPPLLLLTNAAQSDAPSSLFDLYLSLDQNGQPQRFNLSNPVVMSSGKDRDAFERLTPLIDNHLSPLVFSLSARSGVSAKVFWMNAAVVIDYTYDVLLDRKGIDLKQVTGSPTRPNGQRNPLFSPYRPSGSEATRTRRVCCLRYALEGVARCTDCSLKPTTGQEQRPIVLGASASN